MKVTILIVLSLGFIIQVSLAKVKGIRLPAKPDQKKIDKGLFIDVNKNNVRDDIEYVIFEKITQDEKTFNLWLKKVAETELMLKNKANFKQAMEHQINETKIFRCIMNREGTDKQMKNILILDKLIYNTKEKKELNKFILDRIGYPLNEQIEKSNFKCD